MGPFARNGLILRLRLFHLPVMTADLLCFLITHPLVLA